MNRFDQAMRDALRREEPPEGFAERVLDRAGREGSRQGWLVRLRRAFAAPRLRWAAAVALVLLVVAGVSFERRAERRARGEQAKKEVLLALKITARELQRTERIVWRATAGREPGKETIQ